MSFVYDTRLLRELLKIGQQANEPYEDPESYQHRLSMAERVKTMLDALQQQASPPPQTPQQQAMDISYEPDPSNPNAPKLTSTNMETLGALVEWAARSRITVGQQRVAYTASEQPPGEDWVFFKLEPNSGLLERADRTTDMRGYYINVDLLTKFITSRLAALQKKPNKVEEVMLGMRIDDANKLLGTNINKQYAEPENPEDTVDNLPQVLDVKNPYQTGTALPVKIKDLKDVQSLKSLLSRGGITLRDRKGQEFKFDDMGDICAALAILSLRAARLAQGVASGKQKSYVDHVAQMQQSANCASQQQGGQPGGGPQGNAQLLQQLTSLRPFNTQFINFAEIKKWLQVYSQYANNSEVSDSAQNVNDWIDTFKGKVNIGGDTIQLNNLDTNRFKSMLKNQADGINMANFLYDIISQTGALYQGMVTQLQNLEQDQRFAQAYRSMQQQITAGGPQQTNLTDLDDLRNNLTRQWQQHK